MSYNRNDVLLISTSFLWAQMLPPLIRSCLCFCFCLVNVQFSCCGKIVSRGACQALCMLVFNYAASNFTASSHWFWTKRSPLFYCSICDKYSTLKLLKSLKDVCVGSEFKSNRQHRFFLYFFCYSEINTSIFILIAVSKPSLNVIQDYSDFSIHCFSVLEYDYS